jgi:membrane protein YdbS with pleckstrin-like domain
VPLPRKLLNDDEELLAEMQPHWLFFVGPLAAAAAVWAVILTLLISFPHQPEWTSYPLLIIGAVPALWLLGRLIRWRTTTLALTTTRILLRRGILGRDTIQLRLQRITEINLAQTIIERLCGTGRLVIDVQGEDDSLVLTDVKKPAIVQRVVNSQINELVGGGAREEVPDALRPRDYDSRSAAAHRSDRHPADTPPFGTSAVGLVRADDPTSPPTPSPLAFGGDDQDVDSGTGTTADRGSEVSVHERLIELDDLRRRGIITEAEFETKKAELLGRF